MKQTQTTVVVTNTRTPTVRQPGEGPRLAIPLGDQVVTVSRDETLGALEIVSGIVKPTMGTPVHSHRSFDEVFYVLDGTLTLLVGEETHVLPPGGSAIIPAGVVHAYKNESGAEARFLQITAPGGMEGFLRDLAARPFMGFEEVVAIGEEHGTDVLAPPF